jgi:uncharacterized membrane protein
MLKRLLRAVVPAARGPVRPSSVLPAAVFLLVAAGGCLLVVLADLVVFSAPRALLLALVLPWLWWMAHAGHSGLRGARATVSLLVRLCLVVLFIVAMAEPRAVRHTDALSVMYALDVSNSIGESASDGALAYIAQTVTENPRATKDRAGLVVFGGDAAVELPPRTIFPLEAINSRVSVDGTDLAKALSLSAAMLPEEMWGRIVLVSDGVQTEGDLAPVLDDLKARDIPVDVLSVQYAYDHEVWLEKLELPRFVRRGETYEAAAILSSLRAGAGELVLEENGEVVFRGEVQFQPGKNRFALPIYMREPGYYQYVARIEVPDGMDGWPQNNVAINHLNLRGEGKVLVVTSPASQADPRDWEPFVDALQQARVKVEVRDAFALPADPLSLSPYDCVVFVNVPADAFDAMQLEAVRDAVANLGIGFLMVGGPESFGPGGYHRTAVETALPVTMDITEKKVLPKGALVIVLHTCEFQEGNTWAKRIAKEAIRVLGAQDEVGLLAFDYQGGESWVFPLTPAGRYQELVPLINSAHLGDMPSFATTMQMGLVALRNCDAAMKHMIIISDGDPAPPAPALLQAFVDAQVSISTVAINPHNPTDVQGMKGIAEATGGRFYFPQDPRLLPAIFIKEAKTLRRSMIQIETFVPEQVAPSPVMKGIDAWPPLRGYVLTTVKPRALTVLKGPKAEELDPILATWHYGIGKAAAFTSDLSPKWGQDWVPWDQYLAFVRQLMAEITRTQTEGHLQAQAYAAGDSGVVLVEDTHPDDAFLDVEVAVRGPQERSETVRLRQTGPRRYEGTFNLWGRGSYQVVGVGTGAGRADRVVTGFVVPYSPEYLRFRSAPAVLREIAGTTGGRLLTGAEAGAEVFLRDRKPKSTSRPVFDWFLLLLACLLPLDVGVRRVQLDWALIVGWFGLRKRRAPAAETLEALLARKREIEFTRADAVEARRPEPSAGSRAAREDKAPRAPREGAVAAEPGEEEEEMSTTRRLLARKKTWRKE